MKRLIFALMVIALLVPMVAAACPEPPPVCYGDCPTNQTFSTSRTVYENDFVEYSAWGSDHNGSCSNGDGENSGLCEDWTTKGDHKHHHRTVTNEHACPVGYTYQEQSGSDDCRKTENFSVTFDYNKKVGDESKCHRPTGSSLGVPSWAMNEFNNKFPENKNRDSGEQYCPRPPVDCKVSVWTEWSICTAEGQQTRTRTITTQPANGGASCPVLTETQSCTPPVVPIPGCMDSKATNYNPEATEDDGTCKYPPEEPKCIYNPALLATDPLCKPAKECKWEGTGVGVFELWSGPDYTGDYALMYVYDFGDGLPEGVATFRQECVLGWVAQTDTGPWEITRNTCTGQLSWHGLKFTPSEKVIREKTCDRSQPCLVQ